MSKKEVMLTIQDIKVGNKDSLGNRIVDVLATGNEYAIYEIEHTDINKSLKYIIDGYTDDSEKELIHKVNKVKQKYIEAKGLLYRSKNFGMMKNRVGHSLSTVLNEDEHYNGNDEFDKLINDIKTEQKEFIKNRISYIVPSILFTLTILALSLICYIFNETFHIGIKYMMMVLSASSLGGILSMVITIDKLHFEEYKKEYVYTSLGLERLFLSGIIGTITFILIKSEILFSSLSTSNWSIMSLIIVASFSESLIPSLLNQVANKQLKHN